MEKRKTDQYGVPLDDTDFLRQNNVASATDCTGLMPSNPYTEDEAESYSAIYDIAQTKVKKSKIHYDNQIGPDSSKS